MLPDNHQALIIFFFTQSVTFFVSKYNLFEKSTKIQKRIEFGILYSGCTGAASAGDAAQSAAIASFFSRFIIFAISSSVELHESVHAVDVQRHHQRDGKAVQQKLGARGITAEDQYGHCLLAED